MPCYPCTHCNKCGIYSLKMDLRCKTCDEPVVPGAEVCPKCGANYLHNMTRGKIAKPEGTNDYYTKINEYLKSQGKTQL